MPDSRYRITERVASGGMAEVFKGIAESMQGFRKSIAIKRVLPALTQNKKFVAMFLDEARLSLSLQHANIVQVFDIGHADDTYFIVMEYVDGVDLKALLEWRRHMGKRLPTAVSLNIANEICKGLSYAHEMVNPDTGRPLGIVHRDVSPPNVLISKQGEVKVVDFGLAKSRSQIETTDPGVVKGKMSYLSPEAARGEEVDSRADIFSVGILLYEMLTGKRLFYGETDYQTVELVRNARIPPIKAQNPEVEQELEDIVRKALSRKKEDRFQSATDLQDALAHYSYSRGLKVISRDVAELVRQCLEDRAGSSGGRRRGNILDTLLQDEINKMTSVDFVEPGARPLSGDLSVAEERTSDLIDPRGWADEAGPDSGRGPVLNTHTLGRPGDPSRFEPELGRATLKDSSAVPRTADSTGSGSGRSASRRSARVAAPSSTSNIPFDNRPTPAPEISLRPATAPSAPKAPAVDVLGIRAPRGLLIGVLVGVIVLSIAALAGILVSRRSRATASELEVAAPSIAVRSERPRVVPLPAPAETRHLASGAASRRATARQ
jgi:eukaryotic-like serine/threonine-protein kinase